MKTRADYIKDLLSDMEWKDKGEICNMISYKTGGYGDSVARTLRKLTENGMLVKRRYNNKRGSQYKLSELPSKPSKQIKGKTVYQVAKSIRESKECNLRLL